MVSARLDALNQDRVQRSYLERDTGYWADLVLADFAFLEERGGQLAAIQFHQQGSYLTYVGPWGQVSIEFAPANSPDGRWLYGFASLRGGNSAFDGDLDRLARQYQPDVPLPVSSPLNRATSASNVGFFASLLRSVTDRSPSDG
jgi:hypothetical protein